MNRHLFDLSKAAEALSIRPPKVATFGGRASTLCFALAVGSLTLQGCSVPRPYEPPTPTSTQVRPPVAPPATVGDEVAIRAISLLGSPYQWGGNGPTTFDCSGLVRFIHDQLGILVPRTAAEQFSAATPVELNHLEPGDLLFFRINGRRISHVAIYTGEGRFVHAPQTGRPVELRMLDDDFYRPRLAGAGRLF